MKGIILAAFVAGLTLAHSGAMVSMTAPPSSGPEKNFVDGVLCEIHGDGSIATRATLNTNLRTDLMPVDRSPNMSSGNSNGRFENGWIRIGSGTGTPGQTQTSGLDGNGDDFVVKTAGIDIPVVVSKTGLPDITAKVVEWSGLDFTLGGLSTNLAAHYEGGTINVAGVPATINTINGPSRLTVKSVPTIPFVLHDDDDDSVLPRMLSVNAEAIRIFGKVYVFPIMDGAGDAAYIRNDVPFVRNVNLSFLPTVFSFRQSLQSSHNRLARFWCGYVLYAFQPSATPEQIGPIGTGNPKRGDRDPNSEVDLNGLRLPGYGTALFIAPIIELGVLSSEQRLLTHEIAHQFGVPDSYITGSSPPDCIMGNGLYHSGAKFYPEAQDIIRSRKDSPQ